jgi:hypothetical protein
VRHAPAWNLGADATPENVIASQLLGVELPLTLAHLFGEMAPMAKLAPAAIDFLEGSMVELLNGHGLPRGAHLEALRPLAACWTRCAAIAPEVKGAKLTKKTRRQFRGLIRQAFRWTAPDGTQLLSFDSAAAWPPDFARAALRWGGGKQDATAAAELLGSKFTGKFEASKKSPEACYDCEWAGLTVMRRRFSADAPVLAVDYSTPQMRLDVWAGRRRLLGGVVTAESYVNGKLLRPTGPWESLCWFTDKDINYLELSLPLHGDARLDRQILLALRDGFMIIADHLHNTESAELEHAVQIPLGSSLLFCGEGETRDVLLVDGEPSARLMPLALPEWRIDPRGGELSFASGAVRLAEKASGTALACPLFVDLRPERSGQACTWRQLTVADGLQIQPPDVAVSYRIQSGKDQWVLYRSQGPRGNRSFIGQNTSNEFFIGRFNAPSGEVESLLEIEG